MTPDKPPKINPAKFSPRLLVQPPLIRVYLFADRGDGCAMAGSNPDTADMEREPIRTTANTNSKEWNAAAFLACTLAYRRLQQRRTDANLVCTLTLPEQWQC